MNPLLLTLPLLPPLGGGLWMNDGHLSHVNGWGIIAGEPVAYGWRHVEVTSEIGTGQPHNYRIAGVWLADGTVIEGAGRGPYDAAVRDIASDGTAEVVVYGYPRSVIVPGETLGETTAVMDWSCTAITTGDAHVIVVKGFTDHVHLADVTTTGATLPGQDGFSVPDGVVNFDDLGAFQFWWMRPNE